MYYYKRWLWIQFPWCAIDIFSDFSQIMLSTTGKKAEKINSSKENELVASMIAIIRDAKGRKNKFGKAGLSSAPSSTIQKSRPKIGRPPPAPVPATVKAESSKTIEFPPIGRGGSP